MPLAKEHYISIKNGMFDDTTKPDLDALFANLAAHPNRDTIVVYLHGGLVTQKQAMGVAEQTLFDLYSDAGAYPIFFFWQTGLLDLVTGNLNDIFHEKIFQRLLQRVIQFVIAKLAQIPDGRGELLELDGLPVIQQELSDPQQEEAYGQWRSDHMPEDAGLLPVEEKQFEDTLKGDVFFTNETQKIANGLRTPEEIEVDAQVRGSTVRGSTETLMSPSVLQGIRAQAPTPDTRGVITTTRLIKGAVAVLARTIKRFADRRDHGVYVTVIEEILAEFYLTNIGKWGWDLMKGDAADAFKPDSGVHGGTAFLEGLKAYWETGARPRVILAGHSAGSVFICYLLQAAQNVLPPELKFDVVLLAPACNFDLLAETLDKAEGHVAHCRMFTMQDEVEIKNQMLGPVFPRSILYFASGILEDERDKPLVGMHRYFSPNPPFDPTSYPQVERGRQFLNLTPDRTVWSVEDSGPGLRSAADGHGEFDNQDPDTLASLKHIVSEGF
jgi:hypothetical protein